MIKSKPWIEVKVGEVISRYEEFLPQVVKSIELTPSKKSVRYEFESGRKGTERIHTQVYYKGGE